MNNSNEVKRTPGNWFLDTRDKEGNQLYINSLTNNHEAEIASLNIYVNGGIYNVKEAKANAEFICKAVNSYDNIIEQKKQLIEAIKEFRNKYFVENGELLGYLHKELTEIIYKAESK